MSRRATGGTADPATVRLTEHLQPGDVVRVAGVLRTVLSCNPAPENDGWDLVLDPLPPGVLGPLRRPSGEMWAIYNGTEDSSPSEITFGDLTFKLNPLTGETTVTSRTRVLVVEPLEPGQARLTSRRRDPRTGVRI